MMRTTPSPDFGIYFFGDYPQQRTAADAYETLLETARYADEAGFSSVWLPERHFHSFGGVFPNPSVLAAAVAAQTRRIRINAGSVVLPLHDPIRVAEEWSVVDNLSRGRVGIGVASGWNSTDFVFFPDRFGTHRELMYEQVEQVRRLWRGQNLTRTSGTGDTVDVSLYPRPLQPQAPMYTAVVGRRESFARAARADLGIVTNLMTQDIAALADNIAYYRKIRAESGLDPAAGTVSVLVHTYLADDAEQARREAFEPLTGYMRASLSLFGQVTNSLGFNIDLAKASEDDLSYLFGRAYDRYCDSRALIGSPQTCAGTVEKLADAGVDEIASLVDFGLPADRLLAGLPQLNRLRLKAADTAVCAPMTSGQQAMWVQEELVPGNNAQNEPKAVRLTGPLDIDVLKRAVEQLVRRHPALRTVYRNIDGEPSQVVLPSMPTALEVHNRIGDDETEVVSAAISAESRRRFELQTGPLFALSLHSVATDRHILVFSFHHITVDALSIGVITRELSQLYESELSGRPAMLPPPSRRPVALSTDTRQAARDLAYWRDVLDGELPVLQLPTDRPRPSTQTYRARGRFIELDVELTTGLRQLAQSSGSTLFMTLLAGLAATLRRFTGQDDLIVGVPVSQRGPEQRDTVGLLINTIPLRFDTSGDPTFGDLLRRVRRVALDGYDHSSAPLEEIIAEVAPRRDPSRSPLYQITAEFKNGEAFAFDLPGVTATALDAGREVTATDLMIHLTHRDGLVMCHVEYNIDLFDDATIERLGDYLRHILQRATRSPGSRLSELSELTETDRRQLRAWSSGPDAPPPTRSVVDMIEDHANRAPDAVAVTDDTGELTYRELTTEARRLAAILRRRGVGPGDVVATWLPRSRHLPPVLLGIMLAGAAYLPLDPALGPSRIDTVISDSGARFIVSTAGQRDGLPSLPVGHTILDVDSDLDSDAAHENHAHTPALDAPAYVIYTSGSTGRPKGIVASHRNLAWLSDWFGRRFEFGPRGRAAAVCGQSWDVAVMELWPMLAAGGRVAMAPDAARLDPALLSDWLTDTDADFVLLPTALGQEVLALPSHRQPQVQFMMVGGDLLTTLPSVNTPYRLLNIYGPAETTVVVTTYPTTQDSRSPVPLGTPVDGAEFHVLDEQGKPTPIGVPGELYIGGDCVTIGYLNAPGLTRDRFVSDRFGDPAKRLYRSGDRVRWNNQGVLEFCGRTDDQVKIRGFRVEPGEAAAVLRNHREVREAIVLAHRDRHGEARLAAYVVPRHFGDSSLVRRLHVDLAKRLPDYLVPAEWALVERLPLNANGKLDRSALPLPERVSAFDDVAPSTATTAGPDGTRDLLETLWAEILGIDGVDENRSFFEAGGHSITAMRLLARVREEFDVEYPIADFYRDPTLAALRDRTTPAESRPRSGPLSYQQVGMVDGHTRATTAWNIVVHLNLTGRLDTTALEKAVNAVVKRHESLRTRFRHDGEWIQEVQPHDHIDLKPIDLTGAAASEVNDVSTRIGAEPFDIADGHLVRFQLLSVEENAWRLIVVVHHAVCDGWAISVLLADLAAAYRNAVDGHAIDLAPATQAIDYAVWQQNGWSDAVFDARLRFWREVLRDRALTVDLPAEKPASPSDAPAVFAREPVPDELVTGVDRLAADLGCTPFAIWAAALGVLLARRTGHHDLTLGSPYAARERHEHDSVMAIMAMVSILRVDIDPTIGFGQLAVNVLSGYAETVDNFVPLRRILDALATDRDDVPRVMPTSLVYQSSMNLDLELPGVEVAIDEQPSGSPRKRTSFFVEPSAARCRFGVIADGTVHDRSTLDGWLSEWLEILSLGVANPDRPIRELVNETE